MALLKNFVSAINRKIMNNNRVALFIMKVLPPFKFLFGKEYQDIVTTTSFINTKEASRLLSMVNIAINTTPYYKKRVLSNVENINDFENLLQPFNKEVLLNNFEELKSSNYHKRNYDSMTTGGTSGPPTRFLVPKSRFRKEYGFYHKVWAKLGYKEHLRAVIRNERLPKEQHFKINPITKELIFDGFRNNDNYYQIIYKELLKFNIYYIQGYPSAIYNFIIYLSKNGNDLSFIKGIFLSSEIFLEHQRQLLVKTLNLPVVSIYGHSEKLVLAVDFKGNNQYQVIEDYGYLELIDNNGKTIKEQGVLGEIVGTTFNNYGMPLLRYRTGDYSSYLQYTEKGPRMLDGIQGRWQEMKIYNRDGSFVTPTALNLHDKLYNYIEGLQYFQKEMGKLEVRIVPNTLFDNKIETLFLKHFKDRLSPDTLIELVKVSVLTKKKNGKFLLLETLIENQ